MGQMHINMLSVTTDLLFKGCNPNEIFIFIYIYTRSFTKLHNLNARLKNCSKGYTMWINKLS